MHRVLTQLRKDFRTKGADIILEKCPLLQFIVTDAREYSQPLSMMSPLSMDDNCDNECDICEKDLPIYYYIPHPIISTDIGSLCVDCGCITYHKLRDRYVSQSYHKLVLIATLLPRDLVRVIAQIGVVHDIATYRKHLDSDEETERDSDSE